MINIENKVLNNIELEGMERKDIVITDCVFRNCNFLDMHLSDVEINSCEFHNCVIGNISFKNVNVVNADFYHCMLIGIDWSEISRSSFLPFHTLEKCTLKYNFFIKLKLMKFSFEGCGLEGCVFGDCNLTGASFNGADLKDCDFKRNNLQKCDFRNASNYFVDLKDNHVAHARFTLPEAANLLKSFDIDLE